MRPDSLPRLWRYINLLLTYLLMLMYMYRNVMCNVIEILMEGAAFNICEKHIGADDVITAIIP